MISSLRFYSSHSIHPYYNQAIEEYFLHHVQPGECILYLWQNWKTVVVGRNQNAWAECKQEKLEKDGGHLARRLSGGGAVFHDLGNLNFTFVVRHADYDVTKQLSVIREAVAHFGLAAVQTGRNDLVIGDAKFSGNAFYRTGDCCYHHGTILLNVDVQEMSRYLTPNQAKLQAKGVKSVQARVINLSQEVAGITVTAMQDALVAAFGQVYGGVPVVIREDELDKADILRREEHFSSPAWRLGQSPAFTWQSEEQRFDWGCARLGFAVEDGIVKRAALYTDALDAGLAETVSEALEGQPFALAPLTHALTKIGVRELVSLLHLDLETR